MLFLFTITVLVALLAASGMIAFAKRRRPLLEDNQPKNLPEPEFRPLFEPDAEELRAKEREKDAEAAAAEVAESRAKLESKITDLATFRKVWEAEPSRKNTVELLYLASQCESGKIYSETAHEAAKLWKNGQIRGLSANDLSQLLESHLWLLPAGERTSGVSFSIQHEIADLRSLVQGK
jgi:hypothetical protein